MARRQSELELRRTQLSSTSDDVVIKRRGYYIDKLIGYGSYADVFKLVSETDQQPPVMACKIIDASKAPKEYIDRFLPRELEILGKVSHPNIIHIVSIIQRSHKFFIFMRFAEKGDLLEYLLSYGHLSERQARIWFRQIVLALGYLHQINITHRDIKCENILVTDKYNLKLTDFGFARFTVDSGGKVKSSQTFCGSLGYAPPEILKGKSYDPKASDIWSVGVVLFVMINRSMPFYGNSVRSLYKQQIESKWSLNQNIAKLLSDEAKNLLPNMLAANPKKRIKMDELLDNIWFKMDKRLMDDPKMVWENENNDTSRPLKKNKIQLGISQEIHSAAVNETYQESTMLGQPSTIPEKKLSEAKDKRTLLKGSKMEEFIWMDGN